MARENPELRPFWDLHSHVLPGMDDGCQTAGEAVAILRTMAQQGAAGVAATPHYYPEETVAEFLSRRREAHDRLRDALRGEKPVVLCLGAEVAWHPGLVYEDAIRELCLGQSNYLLLEMPFSRWTPGMLRSVGALRHVQGVVPILAHVERYLAMQERHVLEQLLDTGALVQMNADFVSTSRRRASRLLRQGMVDVLGSDCHNATTRPPTLGPVWSQLGEKRLARAIDHIAETSEEIFQQAAGL